MQMLVKPIQPTAILRPVEEYSKLTTRRLFLLHRMKLAYTRRQQRAHLDLLSSASSKAADDQSEVSKVAEVGVRTGVRLMISLLRSVSRDDPELRQEALDFFLEILSELPPLSLWGGSNMSLLLDRSFRSVAMFLNEIVDGDPGSISTDMKLKALKVLLGFALARGSLPVVLLNNKKLCVYTNF